MGALDSAASGAASGSSFGPWGAVIGGAVGLTAGLFKASAAAKQLKQAKALQPANPGYQVNQGVIDNAKTLSDAYGNYTLPGQQFRQDQIDSNFSNGITVGSEGASSGGDLLDLAAKLTYGKNQQEGQLAAEQVAGKQDMLGKYLQAQAAAGAELQGKNAYDREQYDKELATKAALNQAGNENMYGVIDQTATALGSYLNPKKIDSTPPTGKLKILGSIFGSANPSNPASTITNPDGSLNVGMLKKFIGKSQTK